MKSKKHTQRKDQKEAGSSATTHQQVTLTSMARSRDLREEFVIDFLKMATMADILLEKVEKMKPFLLKYSKQAGTLPMAATLRSTYIPRLFDQHFSALKQLLLESAPTPIHITADETTDCRDHSILNVLASLVLVVKHTSLMLSRWRLATIQHLVELSRKLLQRSSYLMSLFAEW